MYMGSTSVDALGPRDGIEIKPKSNTGSYWSPINILKHSFLTTIDPIELKFHVNTRYAKAAKINTNHFGHMTKMATMPKYGKNPLNIFFSGTKRPMALGLGM